MTRRLALANSLITAGAPVDAVVASPSERTIAGLIVPFGPAGVTSMGALTFAAGSITWADPKRVKLLVEHVQREAVGYATELRETSAGVWGKFHVPEGAAGDLALSEAANGVRDAFSVGVQLDAATLRAVRRAAASGQPVAGSGQLRETSLVSVPAFDDARVDDVAAQGAELVISGWISPAEHTPTNAEASVTFDQLLALARAGQLTPNLLASMSELTPDQLAQLATAGQPAGGPQTPPAAPPADPAPVPSPPAPVTTASAGAPPAPPAAAYVTSEASVYEFTGGTSLVRDAYNARLNGDTDARDRLSRFNAQLLDGNAPSVMALAAVETTVTEPDLFPTQGYRPDLFRRIVDRGRPIVARLTVTPLTDATPYKVPVEGEFAGVADHAQGTAHSAEGDQDVAGVVVSPKAKSGAFRVSRELVDASNPAIDSIALNAMLRDYRRKTETDVVAELEAADLTAPATANLAALRAALLAFDAGDDLPPDFIAMGRTMFNTFAAETDADGNPKLRTAPYNPVFGTMRAGYTGADVDGVEIVRASAITTDDGWIIRNDAIHVGESRTQTFRFDEVEGPGVIKLALFGYFAVKTVLPAGISEVSVAVEP